MLKLIRNSTYNENGTVIKICFKTMDSNLNIFYIKYFYFINILIGDFFLKYWF